jgi:homoserine kinase type II
VTSVFVLHHVRADDEYADDAKLIGVYSSKESAQAAVERLRLQPGFRDHPDGFEASEYRLDQDNWEEGFISWDEAMEPGQNESQNAQD